jgi:hypothetical protein
MRDIMALMRYNWEMQMTNDDMAEFRGDGTRTK